MTDQFPPPGWLAGPAIWPYWPSPSDTFTPPQSPTDPWNQIAAQWWRQPTVTDGAATPRLNDAWDRTTPAWLRSAMPPLSNRGILGSFPQPNDLSEASVSSHSDMPSGAGRGILGQFDQWNDPQTSSTGRGILAPLERLNNPSNRIAPAWLQSAAPFGLNDGSFPPPQMIAQPWDNPWLKEPSAWDQAPTPPPVAPRSAARYWAAPEPNGADKVPSPLQHLESANYWGAGPTPPGESVQVPSNGFYLSPVPRAPSWESVPAYPTDHPAQIFQQPPSPTSWDASTPGVNAAGASPNEAALTQGAWDAVGARFARERRAVAERAASRAPDAEADTIEPGWRERTRLNFANSYYRGTLLGAEHLAYLAQLASTPDEPGISPAAKRMRDVLREEYRQAAADLARYDHMRSFGSAGELGAAALGQFGGAILSPESWLGLGAKGATWLARAARAGLQQGAISGGTDPIVQGLNIKAGVQDHYDPWRTAAAFGFGTLLGGGMRLGAEALSHLGSRPRPPPSNERGPTPGSAPPEPIPPRHLTDDEAREAIKAYRAKELRPDLFGQKEEKGVIAVTKGEGQNEFGVNSKLSTYTDENRVAADRLRAKLIEKYPDVTQQDKIGYKIGWWPNDAFYHAETSLLLRLADQNGGSLAGREFTVHVDKAMCSSCKELLPYIGLELGNPTVTFVDHKGRRIIMRDGKLLK
jgi:hypothetical protein